MRFSLPLIITIELHCSAQQQKVMAFLIKKYLKGEFISKKNTNIYSFFMFGFNLDYLFLDYDENNYPTLNDLRKKIIIRVNILINRVS